MDNESQSSLVVDMSFVRIASRAYVFSSCACRNQLANEIIAVDET